MSVKLFAIWAQDRNGAIGKDGQIPWHIPEDFAHFRTFTSGKTVIMGRKTWDSLPKKPLPNRKNIVISRSRNNEIIKDIETQGATVLSFEEALEKAKNGEYGSEIAIIGGSEIYELFMPHLDRLVISEIDFETEKPTSFAPKINNLIWKIENSDAKWEKSEKGILWRVVEYYRI